jgi:hypothetical protein
MRGRRSSAQLVDLAERRMFADSTEPAVVTQSVSKTLKLLIWHYRYQVAPVAVILLLWAGGALLPLAQDAARLVLASAAILTAAIWLFSRRWLDRRIERIYATVCLLAAAAWLFVAARHGVGRPMPAILWPAGCALAGPWWWHYRIRGVPDNPKSQLEPVQLWDQRVGARGRALPGSRIFDIQRIDYGWQATIDLPSGDLTPDDAIAQTNRVTSAFDETLGSVSIEYTPDKKMSFARLMVISENPLHKVLPWPGPTLDPAVGTAPIGLYADGQPAVFRFYLPGWGPLSALIAGATGGGKSRLLELLLAEALHSGLIVPWIADPQGGQSLPRWTDHVDWCALSPVEIKRMLKAARRVKRARQRYMAKVEWTDQHGRTMRGRETFDASPEMPLLVIVIDEAHRTLMDDECREIVEEIAQEGRKTGVNLVLVTQLPSVDQLGGSMLLRSQVASGNVVVFRTADSFTGRMAFNGALPVDPSRLPKTWPDGSSAAGVGFTLSDSDRPVMMRSFLIEDPTHWAETAPKTQLDLISINAAGEDYFNREERLQGFLNGEYEIEQPAAEPVDIPQERQENAADALLTILPEDGAPMDRGDIAYAARNLGITSLSTLNYALRRLVDEGRAIKTGRGSYARVGNGGNNA